MKKIQYKNIFILFISLAASICLSGCIRMGPDYKRPDVISDVPEKWQSDAVSGATSKSKSDWWHVFNNPEINILVEDVMANNFDIKIAAEKVMELRSRFSMSRADRYPHLSLEMQGQRQKQPTGSFSGSENPYESYNLSMPAVFELDLWGRLARAEESARADMLQADEYKKAVMQTSVAESITLYLQMEALERRIQIVKQRIENYRQNKDLVENRYNLGLISFLDVKQARRSLAYSESLMPALDQEIGIVQQKLCLMTGKYPKTRDPGLQPEDYYKRLSPVLPGIPSDVLKNRPDVRAAEEHLKSLNAKAGVAKADRFPRISLTGNLGYSSSELDNLFKPESELWSIAAGLTQPVFKAGKLRAGQKAAESRFRQGVTEYAKTVLTAFAEVEGALLTRKEQLKYRELMLVYLQEARETQQIAERHYERGLTDYLAVLQAQNARYEAEENIVMADLAILTNRVTLHRALGDGFSPRNKN